MYTLAVNRRVGIIIGAIIILLIIAALGFMMMNKSSILNPQDSTQQSIDSNATGSQASIKSLLGAGKNVTCTVAYSENQSSGTIYVADKKFRGDFTITDAGGKQIESHMIQDGNYSYSWSGSQGAKMKLEALATPTPVPGATDQSADLDKKADIKCSAWGVDQSKFAVPADVQFTDLSAVMKQTQDQSTQMKDSNKAACDAIPDPQAKAACLSATGN